MEKGKIKALTFYHAMLRLLSATKYLPDQLIPNFRRIGSKSPSGEF